MTEREEAERLAQLAKIDARSLSPLQQDIWAEAWIAGRESMRMAVDHWYDRMNVAMKELNAERERSQKLVEALKFYAAEPILDPDYDDAGKGRDEAVEAIAEYEASR